MGLWAMQESLWKVKVDFNVQIRKRVRTIVGGPCCETGENRVEEESVE